jgi:hypothetical protein
MLVSFLCVVGTTPRKILAADGAFLPDGRFVTLLAVLGSLLAEGFRRATKHRVFSYFFRSKK